MPAVAAAATPWSKMMAAKLVTPSPKLRTRPESPPQLKLFEPSFWPDARSEAAMFLLTVAMKATVVRRRRDAAMMELRRLARQASLSQRQEAARAAERLQRAFRDARRRKQRRHELATLIEACVRRCVIQRRAGVEFLCLERQLEAQLLKVWQSSATPLSTRAEKWLDCFGGGKTSFVSLGKARRAVVAAASLPHGAADADAAERKALYVALKKRDNLDARTYAHFNVDVHDARRNRRLIAALFSTADLAPASADLVRRLFLCRHRPRPLPSATHNTPSPTSPLETTTTPTATPSRRRHVDDEDDDGYGLSTFAGDVLAWHRRQKADVDLSRLSLAGRITRTAENRTRLFPASAW